MDAGYLAGNPLSLATQPARPVQAAGHALPQPRAVAGGQGYDRGDAGCERHRHRARAAARGALPLALYGAVVADRFYGKGNKTRLVPATDELIVELARYRDAYGLPPMPLPGEARPIVLPIIGKEKPLSRGALHLVLKEVFGMAAERLRWLWTLRSHARSSSRVGLTSGFCSSGRGFAPRFLQTPPRGDALALR